MDKDNVNKIRLAVSSLQEPSLGDSEKLKKFNVIRECLYSCKLQGSVDDKILTRQVFTLCNSELDTSNSELLVSVFTLLELLFNCNSENYVGKVVPHSYLAVAFESNHKYSGTVKECALSCIQTCLHRLVVTNCYDLTQLDSSVNDMEVGSKMFDLLLCVMTDVPANNCLQFFYDTLMSTMFETENVQLRSKLIDFAMELLPRFSIQLLTSCQLEEFKNKVKNCYIKRIGVIRNQNDPSWSKLVKFLLKCFGKVIHSCVDLMNNILKIVEGAFRSHNLDDRYYAYECWKELIDNYSLDMDRLRAPKQMNLLITPLKSNVSTSNPRISHKRLEIWAHLLGTLQQGALPYLKTFFSACYSEDKKSCSEKSQQEPKFHEDATLVLLEVIGHYGHTEESGCYNYEKILKLNEPLVKAENFKEFESWILSALRQCSPVNSQWMPTSDLFQVQKCMWGSFFNLLRGCEAAQQKQTIQIIVADLIFHIKLIHATNKYLLYAIKPILEVLAEGKFFDVNIFNDLIFLPLFKLLLKYSEELFLLDRPLITDLCNYSKDGKPQDVWFMEMYKILTKGEATSVFLNSLILWLECVDNVLSLCHNGGEKNSKMLQNKIVEFMMWPIADLQEIRYYSHQPNIYNEIICKWTTLFRQLANNSEMEAIMVINQLESIIGPKTYGTISLLYNSFKDLGKSDKIDDALLKLTFTMLNNSKLTSCELEQLVPVLLTIYKRSIEKHDSVKFVTVLECFTLILPNSKKYDLLVPFEKLLESIPESLKQSIPQSLIRTLSDLVGGDDKKVSFKADRILKKIHSLEKKFLKPNILSRSTKMVAMSKRETPTSEDATILRLFGQPVVSPSGTIRGSQLNNNPIKSKRIKKPEIPKPSSIFDDDATYVPIDSDYKFDRSKLNDHQLEMLKKDRSDIPALYQDLSQSQSNSVCALVDVQKPNPVLDGQSSDLFQSENQNVGQSGTKDDEKEGDPPPNHVENETQVQMEPVVASENDTGTTVQISLKKLGPVERLLKTLKVDVVGGELFTKVDVTSKRSTRRHSENPHSDSGSKTPKKAKPKKVQLETTEQCSTPTSAPKQYVNARKLLESITEPTSKTVDTAQNSEDVIESSQELSVEPLQHQDDETKAIEELHKLPDEKISAVIDLTVNNDDFDLEEMEIEAGVETPSKLVNIESSPVHLETPTRNAELIEVTEDLSPIAVEKAPGEILESEIKSEPTAENGIVRQEVEIPPKPEDPKIAFVEKSSSSTRAERLLQLASGNSSPATSKLAKSPAKHARRRAFVSAETRRMMKTMQKCQKELQFHRQIDGVPIPNVEYEKEVMDNLLHFAREIPPPGASPSCTILKRKASVIDEEGSSPPRKKRVNYSDPEVTSKKFYIPDINEHGREIIIINKVKTANSCVDSVEIGENESTHTDIDTMVNEIIVSHDNNVCELVDVDVQTENLPDTETQGSIQIADVALLDRDNAVFPQLVECGASVEEVSASLSDPLFVTALLEELRRKNFFTIGDLAKLTELEVNRLPIKPPKITNLRTTLSNYQMTVSEKATKKVCTEWHENNNKIFTPPKQKRRVPLIPVIERNGPSQQFQAPLSDHNALFKPPPSPKQESITVIPHKSDDTIVKPSQDIVTSQHPGEVVMKAINLIKQGAVKEVDRDLCRAVMGLVEPCRLIEILQENDTFKLTAFIKEADWSEVLDKIVKEGGLQKFFSVLNKVPNISPKTVLSTCIEHSLQMYDLTIPHLGLESIINDMHKMCIRSNVPVESFFKYVFCKFTPSIDDLIPSFPHINVVQFGNSTITRKKMKEKELTTFIERILISVESKEICTDISRNVILPLLNENDLTDCVIATASSDSILKICGNLVKHLPKAKPMEDEYETLALCIFDKIPTADLLRYVAKHLNKAADTMDSAR
uniref:Telomere-associated protein Rif1 N-terminal domain-containing protein n=1 Tax=Photinus pyralis TaxID=7054 RepID=A0A1Y1KP09_PHOPY